MFNSRFPNQKVVDEPIYKSEFSVDGTNLSQLINLFRTKDSVLINNTIVESNLIGNVEGSLSIPANTLKEGDHIFIEGSGYMEKNEAGAQTFSFRLKMGGFIPYTVTHSINPVTPTLDYYWQSIIMMYDDGLEIVPTITTIFIINGLQTQVIRQTINPAPFYDNTVANLIEFTGQMSVASANVSVANTMLEGTLITSK